MKLPGGERSVFGHAALHLDHTGGPEVRVRELVFTRPYELDGLPRLLGDAGRFDRRFAGVLPAVCRPCVGHNDPDLGFRDVECARKLRLHAEGHLRASPYVSLSFSHEASAARGSRGACAMYATV